MAWLGQVGLRWSVAREVRGLCGVWLGRGLAWRSVAQVELGLAECGSGGAWLAQGVAWRSVVRAGRISDLLEQGMVGVSMYQFKLLQH